MINTMNLESSEQTDKIIPALVKAWTELEAAPKSARNPQFQGRRYADLTDIVETIKPTLSSHGIMLMQPASSSSENSRQITVASILIHESGQWLSSALIMEATQATPQACGSAITYGRRYSISSMLGIIADDDDDGNVSSSKPKLAEQPRQQLPPSTADAAPKAEKSPEAQRATNMKQELMASLNIGASALGSFFEGCRSLSADLVPAEYMKAMQWVKQSLESGKFSLDEFKGNPQIFGKMWASEQEKEKGKVK